MKYKKALVVCLYCSIFFTDVLGVSGSSGASGGGGRSSSSFSGRSSPKGFLGTPKNNGKQAVGTNTGETKTTKAAKTGGSILSAWGIISLVLFIIVGSALAYYISIFYPLICAKRGKYDVMEMTAV